MNIIYEGQNKPEQLHYGDAGYDLKSAIDISIAPNKRVLVSTETIIDIPFGYVGYIMSRSGLSHKHGITVLNAPGVIDSGYKGELKVLLYNFGEETFNVKKGDRIAQFILQEITTCNFINGVISNKNTERNNKGFGSTGI